MAVGGLGFAIVLQAIVFREAFPPAFLPVAIILLVGFFAWNAGRGIADMARLHSARKETKSIRLGVEPERSDVTDEGAYPLAALHEEWVSEVKTLREAVGSLHVGVFATPNDAELIDEATLVVLEALSKMVSAYGNALPTAEGSPGNEVRVEEKFTVLIDSLSFTIGALRRELVATRPRRARRANVRRAQETVRATYIEICRTYAFLKTARCSTVTT